MDPKIERRLLREYTDKAAANLITLESALSTHKSFLLRSFSALLDRIAARKRIPKINVVRSRESHTRNPAAIQVPEDHTDNRSNSIPSDVRGLAQTGNPHVDPMEITLPSTAAPVAGAETTMTQRQKVSFGAMFVSEFSPAFAKVSAQVAGAWTMLDLLIQKGVIKDGLFQPEKYTTKVMLPRVKDLDKRRKVVGSELMEMKWFYTIAAKVCEIEERREGEAREARERILHEEEERLWKELEREVNREERVEPSVFSTDASNNA